MKAIVIGRHSGEIPGFEIIEKRNLTFPATSQECTLVLEDLLSDAFKAGAALIFQAMPGQMISAITSNIGRGGPITHVPVGVVVSKPGDRSAGKQYTVNPYVFNENVPTLACYDEIKLLAKHCNPNAKVNGFTVTVDPPMQFVFSHVEWLNGG